MNHGDVYVASVAMYLSYSQVLQVLIEADKFNGLSVIPAYLPYITEDTSALEILKEMKLAGTCTPLSSEILLQVIFHRLHNILVLTNSLGKSPLSAEAILDQVLYLIMLALVNCVAVFSLLSSSKTFIRMTLLDVIYELEHHHKFKPYKARAEWIIPQYYLSVPEEVHCRRKIKDTANGAPDPEEVKRRAAQARKEALMKQFKAQQAIFAITFDEEDDGRDGCPRLVRDMYRLPGGAQQLEGVWLLRAPPSKQNNQEAPRWS